MIIDTHVHLLPERLGTRIRRFFEDLGVGGILVYPLDFAQVTAQLRDEGIDEVWTLPYAHKPGMAASLNESTAEVARRPSPVRIVAGATVHPGDDDPEAVVKEATEVLGARVLKLHCSVGGFRADDPRLDGVWRHAARTRVPVVVHAGHAVDGTTAGPELEPVARVAARHPDAVVVIAHCGHPAVDAALDLLGRHPNVHADLTPVLAAPVAIHADALVEFGDRLLFGSDVPNVGVSVRDGLARLRSLGLPSHVLTAITGGNARRLAP